MSALNWISTANAQPPNHLTWVLSSARIGASDPQRPRIVYSPESDRNGAQRLHLSGLPRRCPFAMSRAAGCPATSGEPKRLVRGGTSSGISTPHRFPPAS
jgi:hypothetical protein